MHILFVLKAGIIKQEKVVMLLNNGIEISGILC